MSPDQETFISHIDQNQRTIINHRQTAIADTMIIDERPKIKKLPKYYVYLMRLHDGIVERKTVTIAVESSKPTGVIDYLEAIKILPEWAVYGVVEL